MSGGNRLLAVLPKPSLGRGRWRLNVAPEKLLRSAGVRFGLIYAALFGISAIAIAAFLWWSTAGLLTRQTDAAINADAQGLSESYAQGGVPVLIATIDRRLAANVNDDALYLVVDPTFHYVAGNLDRWPAEITMDVAWSNITIDRNGTRATARVHSFKLAGGFHLLIGRDIAARMQLGHLLTSGMLGAAAIAVALGSLGAWAVRGLFRASLADISATAVAIGGGDFSRRVPVSGVGDEFDLLAETINDMLGRIGRLMDGVRQVSNAIAHDLRTPITRARMRLEDASLHARGEADLRAAIERAQADLDGVVGVFEALLRIAEIEAGSRRSAFARFDLAPVLRDLGELYEAVAEEHGQTLELDVAPDITVFGDRDMLQQAAANLLDNALKFSPAGAAVRLSANVIGSALVLAVADRGPGIPPAARGHATERFYRAEAARSTPGSGLGLALVQAVAQLHGGTLALEDNEPGLRAVIRLPLPTDGPK